uniref:Aa_trans domain-containing protein n=1 Tax=Angiostrongylus cantonensis TaxID=6313 RepID=A0A0K0CUA9_ANGCA
MFSHYPLGLRKAQPRLDYANVMRSAVEIGPSWIRDHGYFCKQMVNVNMFLAQFGFCCVYFVFMADNLKQALAPLAGVANVVYLIAVCIVLQHLLQFDNTTTSLPAVGNWSTLPLFFGTVMFAFEGVAVVLPIESQMDEPLHFITNNGVLNTSCLLVLIVYMTVGFFGYLRFGNDVKDTLTLNLPQTNFYQTIKLMFVACILVSYPLQFYVPMERIEKWIKRKVTSSLWIINEERNINR